MKSILIYPDFV